MKRLLVSVLLAIVLVSVPFIAFAAGSKEQAAGASFITGCSAEGSPGGNLFCAPGGRQACQADSHRDHHGAEQPVR